jgi:hypothetical protein
MRPIVMTYGDYLATAETIRAHIERVTTTPMQRVALVSLAKDLAAVLLERNPAFDARDFIERALGEAGK